MYRETEYLTWANRFFGSVAYNLAKGGMSGVSLAELGIPASLDDARATNVLREKVAHYNGVEPSEVLPALGTTHALWLAFAVLLRPGDEVIVESPGYEPLWRIPQGMGARVVRFERRADEGFEVTVEQIASQLTTRTRVVVITNLHNPTGVRTSANELRQLAELCDTAGAKLLVDEVYAPYGALLGTDGVWGRTARRLAPNVVAVSGLSKAYGLGQLRVGWIVADPMLVRAAEYAIQSTLCDPPIAQTCLAVHAFSRLPALSATRESSMGLCSEVAAWIAARPHLSWHQPRHSPFGFVLVEDVDDLTTTIEKGAREHGVLVAPGAFFGRPNAFRLGWSMSRERLTEALDRLDRVL